MDGEARIVHEDARDASEPERFFFVHLQKTAGASLARMIKDYFGFEAVYPNRTDGEYVPNMMVMVPQLLERWATRREEIRVVTGHFPLCTSELLDAPFRTFTVLREPIERTLSCLRFHKKIAPEDRHLSLDSIYDDPFRFHGFLHNHMVKMFSLTTDEMSDGAITVVEYTRERLERAKENLRSVDVVGLQERFDDLQIALRQEFGWKLGNVRRLNESDYEEAPDGLRERIAEDNALDIELYEFAVQLCAERAAASRAADEALGINV